MRFLDDLGLERFEERKLDSSSLAKLLSIID